MVIWRGYTCGRLRNGCGHMERVWGCLTNGCGHMESSRCVGVVVWVWS